MHTSLKTDHLRLKPSVLQAAIIFLNLWAVESIQDICMLQIPVLVSISSGNLGLGRSYCVTVVAFQTLCCSRGSIKAVSEEIAALYIESQIPLQRAAKINIASQD
jgi:hypothetical protein